MENEQEKVPAALRTVEVDGFVVDARSLREEVGLILCVLWRQ